MIQSKNGKQSIVTVLPLLGKRSDSQKNVYGLLSDCFTIYQSRRCPMCVCVCLFVRVTLVLWSEDKNIILVIQDGNSPVNL